MSGEEYSAKGLFGGSASGGRAFAAYRRRQALDATQRFAELLSQHDLETGDPGGNVVKCSQRMGLKPQQGNAILQRIRRGLGPQAV